MSRKNIRLGLSMRGLGYHPNAWVNDGVPSDGALDIKHYARMARKAEEGLFDMVFLANHSAVIALREPKGAFGRNTEGISELEPLTLLAALSQTTSHIGLVATASTTLHEPYQLARQFASIDHMSGGRAGWNIVTSSRDAEARNFSQDEILSKDLRYKKAREAVEICLGLWESWEPDAFIKDRKSGVYFDPSKLHAINHKGEFFRVDGPLTCPPTPQGRPVLVQAGASSDGMEFAASIADVIFTVHFDLNTAKPFYSKIKDLALSRGRRSSDLLIMPGLMCVVGKTRDEARDKYRRMKNTVNEVTGLERIVRFFGDLSGTDLDGPLPDLRSDIPVVSRGALELKAARDNDWSIREFMAEMSLSHGHGVAVGSPADIADHMERWIDEEGADGFNIVPALSPSAINDFVDLVVPELQRRGRYRTAYEGSNFRENLGLPPVVYGQGLAIHPNQQSME